ncbi:hypothetical protein [Methylobacterium sp. CCH5-D2]|uniref:hypothetical protein n=1 Tax=Methylobacterium sp. CCH5-D2 TaxID=1768765 RepID=UPI0012E38F54|nr:hypothetical protein [Methylobacterium sp. CCH5-D2]
MTDRNIPKPLVGDDDYAMLSEFSRKLHEIRDDIEAHQSAARLPEVLDLCRRARGITDRRYGNVIEQIGRVQDAVAVMKKTSSTGDLYTAVTRVQSALDIHQIYHQRQSEDFT